MANFPDYVIGDSTKLHIPAHERALREGGADFLTQAFRAFGAISPDNRVTEISCVQNCPGGSTGDKLFLSVKYAYDETLHKHLFVKFSRDFSDQVRDRRGKFELEGEVKFAETARAAEFPVLVPKPYFADYQASSHTGLLITERIAFHAGKIERQHEKCMDHELSDPIQHYRVIVRAIARVAAAHRSGRLGDQMDHRFPYDPAKAAAALQVTTNVRALREQITFNAEFVKRNPQLYPTDLDFNQIFSILDAAAARACRYPGRIADFLTHNRKLVALCHWNANIDNCWFWRDDKDALHCGLMDWGHAGQLNLAFSLWGCLSGAARSVWNDHLDDLLNSFVRDIRNAGGPVLDSSELGQHLTLYAFLMYLSFFIHSPSRIMQLLPDVQACSGPLDPAILEIETVRNQLHISTNFFNLMRLRDLDQALDDALGHHQS